MQAPLRARTAASAVHRLPVLASLAGRVPLVAPVPRPQPSAPLRALSVSARTQAKKATKKGGAKGKKGEAVGPKPRLGRVSSKYVLCVCPPCRVA